MQTEQYISTICS